MLGFVYYAFLVNKKIVVFSLFLIYLANVAHVLSVFSARIMTSNISFITIVTRRIHIFSFSSFIATQCISNFSFIPSSISMTNGCSYTLLYFQNLNNPKHNFFFCKFSPNKHISHLFPLRFLRRHFGFATDICFGRKLFL